MSHSPISPIKFAPNERLHRNVCIWNENPLANWQLHFRPAPSKWGGATQTNITLSECAVEQARTYRNMRILNRKSYVCYSRNALVFAYSCTCMYAAKPHAQIPQLSFILSEMHTMLPCCIYGYARSFQFYEPKFA